MKSTTDTSNYWKGEIKVTPEKLYKVIKVPVLTKESSSNLFLLIFSYPKLNMRYFCYLQVLKNPVLSKI